MKMITFKEYLSESRKIYYHGTVNEFEDFADNKINWFVDDVKFAESYAYSHQATSGFNIRPVYLKFNNTFDADKLTKGDNTIKSFAMELYSQSVLEPDVNKAKEFISNIENELLKPKYRFRPQDFWYRNSDIITGKGNQLIFEMIKFFGFDSIRLTEDGHETIGILNSKNITPAIKK